MTQVQILNTVAATAGDLTVSKGTVKIGPSTAPVIRYLDITSASKNVKPATSVSSGAAANFTRSIYEQSQSTDITFSAANSTTYAFSIQQQVGLVQVSLPFYYTSDATATAAEIRAAFVAAINASNLHVTASAASSTITVVADAVSNGNSALFTVTDISGNLTIAPTPSATLATITAISTTGLVTFSGAHSLVTGQTIVIQNCAGAGAANVNDIVYTIEIPIANPTTEVQLVNCGTVGVITVVGVAGYLPGANPFGQYSDVLAALVAAGSTSTPTAGTAYSRLTLSYNPAVSPQIGIARQEEDTYYLYVAEAVVTSSTAIGANYVALETRTGQLLLGLDGSSVIDPNLIAIPV